MQSQEEGALITYLSQQIEIDPTDLASIKHRSNIFTAQGMIDEAISDCTKMLHLEGSREYYVKRSQLFRSKEMFIQALKDLQSAKNIQKGDQQTASDIYLQNSTCMLNIKQVQQLALAADHTPNPPSRTILSQLLQVKYLQKLQQKQNEKKRQIQQLKDYYEDQRKVLEELLRAQLKEIKLKLGYVFIDYEQLFMDDLRKRSLSEGEKRKLELYFRELASEMEKYYIAAKNLHKIEDKAIKFQDFEEIIKEHKSKDYLRKIYKIFDKYSSQVSKLEQIIKEIPYIGTTFKVIKASMKAKGWLEQSKLEHECMNIQRVAVNTTIFNQIATNLAFYMVKHFQKEVLGEQRSFKSRWGELVGRIKRVKEERMAMGQIRHKLSQEEEMVKDYGIIHGSIVMVAFACNQLRLDRQTLLQVNQLYSRGDQQAMERLSSIFTVITVIESMLRKEREGDKKEGTSSGSSSTSSYCTIY